MSDDTPVEGRPIKERAQPATKRRVCIDCNNPNRKAPYVGPRCFTDHRAKTKGKKEQHKENYRQQKFGLEPGRYDQIYHGQGDLCALCGPWTGYNGASRSLSIDHDHDCCPGKTSCGKCVRGLLCKHCNDLLGRIHDDPQFGLRLIAYVLAPPAQDLDRWASLVMDLIPVKRGGKDEIGVESGESALDRARMVLAGALWAELAGGDRP